MRARSLVRTAAVLVAVSLSILLSSCQLLGGGTQVSFSNTTTFTITTIQFGPVIVSNPVTPGSQTGSFPIPPGQNVLTAESQNGTWTNGILLTIAVGHSYTITFSGSTFSAMIVNMKADN
jgi:hypothetical protein